jgi:hypothetical protein
MMVKHLCWEKKILAIIKRTVARRALRQYDLAWDPDPRIDHSFRAIETGGIMKMCI